VLANLLYRLVESAQARGTINVRGKGQDQLPRGIEDVHVQQAHRGWGVDDANIVVAFNASEH